MPEAGNTWCSGARNTSNSLDNAPECPIGSGVSPVQLAARVIACLRGATQSPPQADSSRSKRWSVGATDFAGVGMSALSKVSQPGLPSAIPEDERLRLFEIVRERSFKKGSFKLSSGQISNVYFNLKPTMMVPEGAFLCAKAFFNLITKTGARVAGGLEMGAVPIISNVALLSHLEKDPIRTFFVRKEPKAHGTGETIEGTLRPEELTGQLVVIADDVTTSGKSVMKAVDAVRQAGAMVEVAISLVDRDEGAEALLAKNGVRLISVFHSHEFL
ncbi:MAG: orotate phosphoribosyltransferase [Caulobacteraceae bacterium]